jgi:NAD(P)-dependent dehydrogenase (short-subunit alcohol dehydrogenase family)
MEGPLMAGKTWFITGASRGFGREWAVAALDRGDQVAATARNVTSLDDLAAKYGDAILPLGLDVTDRDAGFAAVKLAHDYFGRLDVTVYDAGCGQFGMVEEIGEAEIRAQLETNLLGALWITQAALPYLREQGSGHIVQVSSIGGISAFPNTGAYHASQWALEGLTQSLAAEVARFGVKVTLIVPTGYTMDWADSIASPVTELPVYEPVRVRAAQAHARRPAPVDPDAAREAVLKLVDSPNPPLRLFLGEAPSQAGFTGVVAASRNRSSSASRAREWLLAAMPAVRLAGNG